MIEVYVSHLVGEEAIHLDYTIDYGCVYTQKGDEIIRAEDDGDGVDLYFGSKGIRIDYCTEEALLALLLSRYDSPMKLIQKIIEI